MSLLAVHGLILLPLLGCVHHVDELRDDPAFLDVYPLDAGFPESGTYDPTTHAIFVGSLADGSVHRIDAATGAEQLWFTETAPGTWWTLGMDVDVARRRLWVCAVDDRVGEPRAGAIWVLDLDTGERLANHPLAAASADATCADVALTSDGVGYVPDREHPNVYRVDLTEGATLFATDPALQAPLIGLNAAVVLPDQSALLSVLYLPPTLVRVDLGDGSVQTVVIDGAFSDPTPLAGADGMAWAEGSAWVAFSSRLMKLTPTDESWAEAGLTTAEIPSGHTDVVATPGGLYVLNGQAISFALGAEPEPFALTRFEGEL